jgi:hypothetical protein
VIHGHDEDQLVGGRIVHVRLIEEALQDLPLGVEDAALPALIV